MTLLYYKFILRPPILGKIPFTVLPFFLYFLKPLPWLFLINYWLLKRNWFLETTLIYQHRRWFLQQNEIKINNVFLLPSCIAITVNAQFYLILPEQLPQQAFRKLLYLIKKGE